jgi:type II secretory ATPase GspE/PulE/Tfp pilus assembly ATPase PilB-like protein
MAILEVLSVTTVIREQILQNASAKVIKDAALKENMKTLRMAGLTKAKAGFVPLDEVLRVTGSDT